MSIENPMSKPHTFFGLLCVPKPYTAPTEPERSTAIDMLLFWSKSIHFGVVLCVALVHPNLHDAPIFYVELTLLAII